MSKKWLPVSLDTPYYPIPQASNIVQPDMSHIQKISSKYKFPRENKVMVYLSSYIYPELMKIVIAIGYKAVRAV